MIGEAACFGLTDSVVAGAPNLVNESNPDQTNGIDGIDTLSSRTQREEEFPVEISACSETRKDRVRVTALG